MLCQPTAAGVFAVISPVYALSYAVQNTAKCLDISYLKTTYDRIFMLAMCDTYLIETQYIFLFYLRKF